MKRTDLTADRYENIFNIHKNEDGMFYYNILDKINISNSLDPVVYEYYRVPKMMPWTTISHRIYGSQFLWWLICKVNNVQNPMKMLAPGTIIKVIKPEYVPQILNEINQ